MASLKRKVPASGSASDGKKAKKLKPSAASTLKKGGVKKPKDAKKKGATEKKPDPIPQNNAEKKAMIRAKKEQKNPNFALVQECVFIWEELRPRDASTEDKQKLVAKVVAKAKGRFKELAMNHSSSRVVQACLKYGTADHRKLIWKDCRDHLLDLSRSNYGSFVIRKFIDSAKKAELPGITRAFKGKVALLFRHPCGSAVMTDLYEALASKERNAMVAEFYSKEHALFGTTHKDAHKASLQAIWDGLDGPKRRALMQHLIQNLQPIIEKGLLDPTPVHRLVLEYLQLAPSGMLEDAVELLSGESLLRMVHTHDGAKVGCMVAAYGTPKDRKKLVKALKGHVVKMAGDEFAYGALTKLLSCVDDTQLMRKVVVQELAEAVPDLCSSKHGSRVLLYLLHPACSRYLPPHIMQMLQPPKRLVSMTAIKDAPAEAAATEPEEAAAAEEGADEEAPVVGASKKDPEVRRLELLGSGKGSLAAALLAHSTAHAQEMLRSPLAADIVVELCQGDCAGSLWEACEDEVRDLHRAVAEAASAHDEADQEMATEEVEGPAPPPQEPLLEHYFASRAILRVVLACAAEGPPGAASCAFARALWDAAVKGRCKALAASHAAKIVAALANCGDGALASEVKGELSDCVDDVDAWLAGGWKSKT